MATYRRHCRSGSYRRRRITLSRKTFHLGYFTKFGVPSWSSNPDLDSATNWANGSFHIDLAKRLERAKFDFVFFEDSVTVAEKYGNSTELDLKHAVYAPKHDPLPLLPLMAHETSDIGFIATASTSFYPPFLLARLYSTIDSLSEGRVGWNIVTSSETAAACNFGMDELPPHGERYARAEEFVDVTKALWDSWEDGSLVADLETGVYVDHTKVHTVDYEGRYYRSKGPLNTLRSPQGRPVLAQAGASDRGRDFAAKNAEVIVGLSTGGVEDMKEFRKDIRARAKAFGRDPDDCKIFYLAQLYITEEEREISEKERDALLEYVLVMMSSSLNIDFSQFDLDAPLDQNVEAGGHTSALDALKEAGSAGMTLRETILAGYGQSAVGLSGSPEEIADRMVEIMDEVGGDGFLIEGNGFTPHLPALTDRIVPRLQQAGAVRTEYKGNTLRELLHEF
ncbi:NtaA/DmoA family FMN-dependent monooxygenase [Nocardia sp. NPDC058499]|uniref:NtaA/DmoA family FMN-dependent monooxygenase n=1 Tax=Nocardia sp. NPDC058499 TaxID=3346530 RepID=UPI00364B239B